MILSYGSFIRRLYRKQLSVIDTINVQQCNIQMGIEQPLAHIRMWNVSLVTLLVGEISQTGSSHMIILCTLLYSNDSHCMSFQFLT